MCLFGVTWPSILQDLIYQPLSGGPNPYLWIWAGVSDKKANRHSPSHHHLVLGSKTRTAMQQFPQLHTLEGSLAFALPVWSGHAGL